ELDDLRPYLATMPLGPRFAQFLDSVDRTARRTIDFLVDLNRQVQDAIEYVIRLEPGVQTPEETLLLRQGSCRDSALLLLHLLRHLGFASRFVSGYLIQLKPDQKSLDGPSGTEEDFTDLHAWTEVYLPGAGWIGLDPTSGLLAGEGHIPLACTPSPQSAAPISGSLELCETQFDFSMSVERIYETPRVTKPYTEEQWHRIESLGHAIDVHLEKGDVRLTMGGEPTFVSIDDMEGEEWKTEALGPTKRRLANQIFQRLQQRFADGGLPHYGQGKWYPGEPLPRWALRCYWRKDGQPIWQDSQWYADDDTDYGMTADDARQFTQALADRLGVDAQHALDGYEDVFYYMWKERRLPANVSLRDNCLEDETERKRLARVFEQGITSSVGCVLPLQYRWWGPQPGWQSGFWAVRSEELFLIPGDSPMGYRLPLQSLVYVGEAQPLAELYPRDPFDARAELPSYQQLRMHLANGQASKAHSHASTLVHQFAPASGSDGNGDSRLLDESAFETLVTDNAASQPVTNDIVRTALCVEPRHGRLHIFLPPVDLLEHYLELITAIEQTAASLQMPVVIEGYHPPQDNRLQHFSVTPDPGVIEVNVHPAHNWSELVDITTSVYEDARASRLGTEKFDLDGTHTGTGGGNHVVLGGPTPGDSPFLRRPDLLKSLLAYWHNHPSLSYLFSGRFIGPTSQAPRVDEGRQDSVYELKIAFQQVGQQMHCPAWLVDRIFRHLLVDVTGNTHRAEFCIDKLFSPDSSSGRLGLVEFRAFEMPPHARMSLTQQLLLRCLVARFWENPYEVEIANWRTSLHDRFLLPHFVWQDFEDVISETRDAGYAMELEWFAPHFEFRFPKIGEFTQRSVKVELRQAIEPWYVLGEEPGGGFTARYVDSSLQRLQVKTFGMTDDRYSVTCNGRTLPLHPTGTQGEYVAGVRYRAWQPPHCLHPTIGVDVPLVFDLYDQWQQRSLGGCRYNVEHPGGLNPSTFPVNAYEAESRRGVRFSRLGHSGGHYSAAPAQVNPDFPLTLDLRFQPS
ncbi:MAG: transglutaminase family protein, partial [Planctomycetales bacterium]|nr:transglutaminase family protein [Planctomycetales bacterium]